MTGVITDIHEPEPIGTVRMELRRGPRGEAIRARAATAGGAAGHRGDRRAAETAHGCAGAGNVGDGRSRAEALEERE